MPDVVFFADRRGDEPVLKYIRVVARRRPAEAAAIERYIDLLETHGERLAMPYARRIDAPLRIYELRPGAHRVAYAADAGRYVLLHAWRKTARQLDQRALTIARNRLEEWKFRKK